MPQDYSKLTREQLEALLHKLEARKRYGLSWEDKPEDVALQCEIELPILHEQQNKAVRTGDEEPNNVLIEGDNYHALSVLSYTHAERVDVIYIDPPYNTGAKDWKYNNSFVDINDSYRHSKWLSMMVKRLNLAKKLLKPDGVLICAIDENEFNRLGLLLEYVFPSSELHCITIVHRKYTFNKVCNC